MTDPTQAEVRARITAASEALLGKPYLSDHDRERVRLLAGTALTASGHQAPPVSVADEARAREVLAQTGGFPSSYAAHQRDTDTVPLGIAIDAMLAFRSYVS